MSRSPEFSLKPIVSSPETIPSSLWRIARKNQKLLNILTAGLIFTGVTTTFQSTEASAQDTWAATVSNPDQGTVPVPTPEQPETDPYEIWNVYALSLQDEDGNIPEDALVSAYRTKLDGTEELIFQNNRIDQDQKFHNASFAQHPGETVRFELSSEENHITVYGISTVKAPVNKVNVKNIRPEETDARLTISTVDPEEVTMESDLEQTSVVTSTIDGKNSKMKIEIDGPVGNSDLEITGLPTGELDLDVQELSNVFAVNIAADSGQTYDLGTLAGTAPEGIDIKLTLNGEAFSFSSDHPFDGEHRFLLNSEGLTVDNYNTDTPVEPPTQDLTHPSLFLPSLGKSKG